MDRYGIGLNINLGGGTPRTYNQWGVSGGCPVGPMAGVAPMSGRTWQENINVYDDFGERVAKFTGWITEMRPNNRFMNDYPTYHVDGTFTKESSFGRGTVCSQVSQTVELGLMDRDKDPSHWLHKALPWDLRF